MKNFLLVTFVLIKTIVFAQVGIGTTNPNSSSVLDLVSTNKALLLPRIANTTLISAPSNGMIVFDLSSNSIKIYQNGGWSSYLTSASTGASVVEDCSLNSFQGTYKMV